MEIFFMYLKIIFALTAVWLRGYFLIYLINRSKCFSFGFKFFAGWLLGLAGFTLDVFSYNVFTGFKLEYWVFLFGVVQQIFGFGFVILLLERKLPYPKIKNFQPFVNNLFSNLKRYNFFEKSALAFLIFVVLLQCLLAANQIKRLPVYAFDYHQNINYKAKTIFFDKNINQDKQSPFYLGGGDQIQPLNDTILKVWVASNVGYFSDRNINYISIFYFLILLAIFYFCLPNQASVTLKFIVTGCLALLPPLIYNSVGVPIHDWLLSIFIMLMIYSFIAYLYGRGNSFFYFSGMAWAYTAWIDNTGLIILFPVLIIATIIVYALKKVSLKDFLLSWFFAILTAFTWMSFVALKKVNILYFDLNYFGYQFLPAFVLLVAYLLNYFINNFKKKKFKISEKV